VGDLLEAIGPVVAAPREDLDHLLATLHAVAVDLDFVNPARPGGDRRDRGSQPGLVRKGGRGRLHAYRRRMWKRVSVLTVSLTPR